MKTCQRLKLQNFLSNVSGPYCGFPNALEPIKMPYFGEWTAQKHLPYTYEIYMIIYNLAILAKSSWNDTPIRNICELHAKFHAIDKT